MSTTTILAHFRVVAQRTDLERDVFRRTRIDIAHLWLRLLEEDPAMQQPLKWGRLAGTYSPAEIEHARRILTKYVSVYDPTGTHRGHTVDILASKYPHL